MPRPTRNPNTQTAEERALWHKIKAQQAARTQEKRKRYGLKSNREAHLHVAPRQSHAIAPGKIIPFPPETRDHTNPR